MATSHCSWDPRLVIYVDTPPGRVYNRIMKIIAYIRVSTGKQHEGPHAQRASIDQWAKNNGYMVEEYFTEVVSGATDHAKREILMDAINCLKAGDIFVAAKRDRIARDVIQAAMIDSLVRRAGARMVTLDIMDESQDPAAQLMRTMVDAFAQYERALIAARTKAALRAKARRGEVIGGSQPYGYRRNGNMVVQDVEEQRILNRMRMLRKDGLSYQKITDVLQTEGHRPRGDTWYKNTVVRALTATK